jgi:hypothetical protein
VYGTIERTEATTTTTAACGDITARAAGIGAITFAGVVVLQNVLRGGFPANDATTEEVLTHYADHRGLTAVLAGTFVVSGIAIAMFLGGAVRRFLAGGRQAWAITGLVGAISVLALFSVVVGAEQALSVVAQHDAPNLGAIEALWAFHNSVFTVLYLSLAITLLGLSKAGVAAGTTPRVFDRLGPVGAGLLVVAALAGPFIAAGEAMPLFGIGGIGFLIWLAFLVTTGRRLLAAGDVEV